MYPCRSRDKTGVFSRAVAVSAVAPATAGHGLLAAVDEEVLKVAVLVVPLLVGRLPGLAAASAGGALRLSVERAALAQAADVSQARESGSARPRS